MSQFGWVGTSAGFGTDAGLPGNGGQRPELADLGRLVRRGLRGVVRVARAEEQPTLASIVHAHLGGGGDLPVVVENWPGYEHVNVQAAVDAWLAGRAHELVGVVGFQHQPFGLADLLSGSPELATPFGPRPGPVARANLPCGPGEVRACVRCGLYLVHDGNRRLAVLLRGADPESGTTSVTVHVAAEDVESAGDAARQIRELALRHNVVRGQVVSFGGDVFGGRDALLHFHRRPVMTAGELVLPPAVLDSVERQVVGVARHRDRLLAAGQHLKRGLLLYGPPGTGKTHTVRYLTASLTGVTVVQLTGQAMHLIAEACSIARALQPAMVVVEDVDLIADERGLHDGGHPLLFQLLNEMDGLAEDADVVFLLTTNRADLLEPALASRPGRVDQAVEIALPDAGARRRLFELYRGDLEVDATRLDDVLDRTDGVTASFIKELLRRAALMAAERIGPGDTPLKVAAEDLDAALTELLDTRNAMTRTVLGSGPA